MILAHLTDAVCSEELRFLRKSFQKPPKIISKLSFEHLRRVSETSGKIIRKSFQKSFQKPAKNLPKYYQNPISKGSNTKSKKKSSFALFVAPPGRFGRRLGASWVCPGGVLARLGASWERLGASWERLGSLLARLGPPVWCLSFC